MINARTSLRNVLAACSMVVIYALFGTGCGPEGPSGTTWALTVSVQGQGSVVPSSGTYADGTELSFEATPASGWQFDHWEGDLTGDDNPAFVTITEDMAVTAVFTEIPGDQQYSLTVAADGQGSVARDPDATAYDSGTVVSLTATPAAGWEFDHWEGGLTGSTNPATITVNADTTVTAVFVEEGTQYALTVSTQGQGSVAKNPDEAGYDAGSQVTLTATAASGWEFDHWEGDLTGSTNPATITMDADTAVTAVFVEEGTQYALTVSAQGQGSVAKNPDEAGYDSGSQVTLTATASSGWEFDHWEGGLTGSTNPATITVNADTTVTAVFVETTPHYTLTVNIDGQGSVAKNPSAASYETGTQVSLTATAASGWRFDHWTGDITGSTNPASITMNGNKTVTAVFAAFGQGSTLFTAVYDWVTDDDTRTDGVYHPVLSGNGQKVVFVNYAADTGRKASLMNPDGSGLTTYNIPDGTGGLGDAAIDQDGSRAFVASLYDRTIYKIEGGQVTPISVAIEGGPTWVEDLQTTSDGAYVYFLDTASTRDIWRVGHDGNGLTRVQDDGLVSRDGGNGYSISDMAVSDDGNVIVFTLYGYWTEATGVVAMNDVFTRVGGSVTRITTDGKTKGSVAVSGDGSTIIYTVFGDDNHYYSANPDGSGKTQLEYAGHNFAGMALTYDGSKMFYDDANADGGRLVNTDGSGALDLFPGWNVTCITLAATYDLSISDDGSRVCFRFEYASWPFKRAIHVGYLNPVTAPVASAPSITSIAFSPAAMPRGDASARVVMAATVTDPQGLSDVTNVSSDEMIAGRINNNSPDLPASFYFYPHDDGASPDVTAGDGVYSTIGEPGGKIDTLNAVRIRVSAKDKSKTVVVKDTTLPIGTAP